jgi:insulysin
MKNYFTYDATKQIIKSPLDPCDYKLIKLNNGMEVLLISDQNIKLSYASMIVKTGSLMEKETLGLAHFLEHMLFLGNKKYPKGEKYFEYVNTHSGKTNAFTDSIHTCYYFSIDSRFLNECLDMFRNFFIEPLFDETLIDREINAVDSEYRKNINIDIFRYKQILKEITVETHPFKNFDVGSVDTLKKPTIRRELIEFYHKYYSSDKMKLIIAHNRPISEMLKMAELFNEVPKCPRPKNEVIKNIYGDPFTHGNIIKMIPLNNLHSMFLLWTINYKKEYKKFKILRYIFYLLGRESQGSLSNILINYSLINEIQIASLANFGDYMVVCVELKLTNYGLKNVDIIVNIFTKYIETLKKLKINRKNFDIFQKCNKLNFLFEEPVQIEQRVMNIVSNVCSYYAKLHEAVSQSSLICEYDETADDVYQYYLSLLNSQRINIILSSHKYASEVTTKEKWYDIHYSMEKNTLKNEMNIQFEKIHYFDTIFIPTKLLLNKREQKIVKLNYPFNIFVHYDNMKVPKVCVVVELSVPHMYDNIHSYVTHNILLKSINYNIRKHLYDAILCNSMFSMDIIRDKIVIKLIGFNDRIDKMLDCVKDNLLKQNNNYASFMYAKNLFQMEIEEFMSAPPFERINDIVDEVCCEKYFKARDVLKEIILCDKTESLQFDLLNDAKIQCIINGNFNRQHCQKMCDIFQNLYTQIKSTKSFIDINNWKLKEYEHTDNTKTIQHYNSNEDNELCCALICTELAQHNSEKFDKLFALSMLTQKILSDKFFDTLRTKAQLGYIVRSDFDVIGMRNVIVCQKYYVQSASYSVKEISERINKFFRDTKEIIHDLDEQKLKVYIDGCITIIMDKKMHILDKTMELFGEIIHERYDFNNKKFLVQIFSKISPQILYDFYKKYFLSEFRKKIFVNCIPKIH